MVDEERVTRLLAGISADLDRLEDLAARVRSSPGDVLLDAVKYRFVTAIEGCVRVAHHIVAAQTWGSPDTNADAVRLLGVHGVVLDDTAASLASAVGFRNVLVHQYTDVDDRRVLENLDRCSDLDDFVAAVASWVESSGGRPAER